MTALLSVEGLAAGYGGALAVRGLDFAVAEGSIAVLVGANGAGKTTTVQVIAGALRPSGGTVRFAGEAVTGRDCPVMVERGVTLVPEGRLIFSRMTVEENLKMGAINRRAARNLDRNLERVFTLFPRLAQRRRQFGGSMSGGEQQMLAIARGLMAEPRLMILDEPSLGLAPKIVAEMFGLIRQLNAEGITIVLVEQNVRQSLQLADQAFVIEKGRVVLSGDGPTLLDDPFVRTAFLGL
jgi:branched-chain amino acid transport system ATP-binding protein